MDEIVVTAVGLALPGVTGLPDLLDDTSGPAEPVDPSARLGRRGLRYQDRATQLALCAADDAIGGRGTPGDATGVVVSSNFGNVDTVCRTASAIPVETTSRLSPMALPTASSNVIAASVAIRFGLRASNLTLCNGPTSGVDAVHWAARLVTAGRAGACLVVGVEPRNDVVARLTGTAQEDLLDGAVALVVEPADSARSRGAPVLARLGRYAREATVPACLKQVLADDPPPGVWFVPERYAEPGPLPGSVPRRDLTSWLGRASGALGVAQCAAAIAWFATTAADRAVVTSGADTDDAVAGTLLAREEPR